MTPTDARSGGLGLFILGAVFGTAVAGIGVFVWKERELQRSQSLAMQAAAEKALFTAKNAIESFTPTSSAPTEDVIAAKIKKLGDECVIDLHADRVLSVYRLTNKDYQRKTPRDQFEQMVRGVGKIRAIFESQLESKARKSADGKRYEYYCTARTNNNSGSVNVALVFVEADGDWRIDEFELKQDN